MPKHLRQKVIGVKRGSRQRGTAGVGKQKGNLCN
jgi:hypothetical protein